MIENVTKVRLNWKDIEDKIDIIVDKLSSTTDIYKFDAVVSIGRGGMIPARLIAEKFDIHTIYIIDAKAYTEDDKLGDMQISEIKISNNIKNIIVVDDCIFTGTTLNAVKTEIFKNKQIENVVNVFLYKNEKMPDIDLNYIYAESYNGDTTWLVFPWEKS